MSVINDMLRDLEQRKAAGRDGLNHAGTLPVVQVASSSSLRTWLLALLVVLLALGLGVWFWQTTYTPTVSEAVVAVEPEQKARVAEAAPSVETTEPESTPEPVGKQTAEPEPVGMPAQVQAEVATKALPVEANAVIEQAPVVEEKAVAEEKAVTAQKPVVADKIVMAEKTPAAEQAVPEDPAPVAEKAAVAPTPEIAQPSEPVAQTAPPEELPVVDLPPEKAVVQVAPKPVVTLTPQAQDLKQAAEARALLRRGEIDTALSQLRQFIDQAEVDQKSRVVLVNYLLQYDRLAEAGDVLLGAPVDKDPDLRQLKARWLAVGGRPHEAISLLESDKPELAAFPDYHALLASFYQQLGQAEPAAGVYAELLKFNPAQANWWAGRALALDRLARYDEAKVAYERALVLPGLSGQLAQFAKLRLESL